MKITGKIILAAAAALAAGCAPEDLKEANFDLFQAEGIKVIAGDGSATVTWTKQEGKPDPAEYIVRWTPDSEELEGGSANVGPDTFKYTVGDLVNDCQYTFGVQASYEKGLAMEITATATPKSTRIAAGSFRAVAGDKLAVLTWTAPDTDLEYSYEIAMEAAGEQARSVKVESDETRYVAEGLTNGTEYTFSLTCVYSHGNSETVTATATPGDIQAIITDKTALRQFELGTFEYNPAYFIKDEIREVKWDFGDGMTSDETTASHLWSGTGSYTVTVTVTYADGSTQSADITVSVEAFGWSKTSGLGYQKASNVVFSHDGQTFYMGSPTAPTGLFAVSAITGEIIWSYPVSANVYGEGPAVGSDGTIYFTAEDNDGTIHAITPEGKLKWSKTLGKKIQASPAVTSDGTLYVLANEGIFKAFDAVSGEEKWSADVDGTAGGIAVDADGTVYVGTNPGIWAFSGDGSMKWKAGKDYAVSERGGSLAISDGVLYAVLKSKGGCVALDTSDGSELWQYKSQENDCYHPAVDTEGTVYFCEKNGNVYAVRKDGTLKWSTSDKTGYTYSGFALGADGKAYISQYGGDKNVVAFDIASGNMETVNAIGAQTMSPVVIGPDGRLYYGTNPEINAFDIGTSLAEGGWPMRGCNLQGTNSLK